MNVPLLRDPRFHVEGHAIVSADGMIAAADGSMPEALRNAADWRLFQAALDRAALVVLGRKGHERHPNPGRRRLVLTRGIADFANDPKDLWSHFWNPAGIGLPEVLARLGLEGGTIAVTGGTGTFDLFAANFDSFSLAEAQTFTANSPVFCFSAGHPRNVLANNGLRPGSFEILDGAAAVTRTIWRRP